MAIELPRLSDFLNGRYEPANIDERMALLGVCQFTYRALNTARISAAVFAAAPQVADDLSGGCRFRAARAAAMAGCGGGVDAQNLGEADRRRWRDQARQWLRADLTALGHLLAANRSRRATVAQYLGRMQNDLDLAGVRDSAELDKLADSERNDWRELWDGVARVLKQAGELG